MTRWDPDVKLPNSERAVIRCEKLYGYLLSRAHPVGRFKAEFFARLGYMSDTWPRLRDDLRAQHLSQDAQLVATTAFGRKYAIRANLEGPKGEAAMVISIWFVPKGGDVPEFVTAYPGGRS